MRIRKIDVKKAPGADCWIYIPAIRALAKGEPFDDDLIEYFRNEVWQGATGEKPDEGIYMECSTPYCMNPEHMRVEGLGPVMFADYCSWEHAVYGGGCKRCSTLALNRTIQEGRETVRRQNDEAARIRREEMTKYEQENKERGKE